MNWSQIVSLVSSLATVIAFVGVFVKMGKEKGINETTQKEMRKDIEENVKRTDVLDTKIQQIQLESTKLITMLSNDLGWIKANLVEIRNDMKNKKEN